MGGPPSELMDGSQPGDHGCVADFRGAPHRTGGSSPMTVGHLSAMPDSSRGDDSVQQYAVPVSTRTAVGEESLDPRWFTNIGLSELTNTGGLASVRGYGEVAHTAPPGGYYPHLTLGDTPAAEAALPFDGHRYVLALAREKGLSDEETIAIQTRLQSESRGRGRSATREMIDAIFALPRAATPQPLISGEPLVIGPPPLTSELHLGGEASPSPAPCVGKMAAGVPASSGTPPLEHSPQAAFRLIIGEEYESAVRAGLEPSVAELVSSRMQTRLEGYNPGPPGSRLFLDSCRDIRRTLRAAFERELGAVRSGNTMQTLTSPPPAYSPVVTDRAQPLPPRGVGELPTGGGSPHSSGNGSGSSHASVCTNNAGRMSPALSVASETAAPHSGPSSGASEPRGLCTEGVAVGEGVAPVASYTNSNNCGNTVTGSGNVSESTAALELAKEALRSSADAQKRNEERMGALFERLLEDRSEKDSGGPWRHEVFEWVRFTHTAPSSTFFRKTEASRDVTERVAEVPSSKDKQASAKFWDGYARDVLLKPFVDDMSDADYAERKYELTEALYLLACTQRSDAAGEGQAQTALKMAIKSYQGRSAPYTQLARVCENYEQQREAFIGEMAQHGNKTAPDLWAILHTMDSQFCSSTKAAARLAWEESFQKKTLSHGVLPEQTLLDFYKLCKQRYSDLEEAKDEALHRFKSNIQSQVKQFGEPLCLYELEKIVLAPSFQDMSIDDGVKRLKSFFTSDSQGKKVKEYLNKKGPASLPGADGDKRLEKRISALESQAKSTPPSNPPPSNPPPSNPPSTPPPAIHALGGVPTGGMDAAWVQREGVEGYPAPQDTKKPCLAVVKIYSHMKIPLSNTFPESSMEKVGPDCPGCKRARPAIPATGWYYRPTDPLFSTAGGGRVRPVVGKFADGNPKYEANTGWMHNASFCQHVWADVHRWVRAHPEDKWMFDAVPPGENSYARPGNH